MCPGLGNAMRNLPTFNVCVVSDTVYRAIYKTTRAEQLAAEGGDTGFVSRPPCPLLVFPLAMKGLPSFRQRLCAQSLLW